MSRTIKNLYDSFSGFAFKSIDFSSDGIPLIRIGDINNSEIQFTENTAFLPDFFAEKYKRFLVQKGDVLIGLSGASLGKFGIYKQERKALVNQRILVLREKEDFQSSTQYLAYYLHILQKGIENKAVGGAQPNISPKKILRFEILHPIEDQLKIVGQLNRIQELIDKRIETIQLLDNYIRSVFLEMFGDPYINPRRYTKRKLKDLVKEDSIITYGIVQAGPHIESGIPYIRTRDIKNCEILVDQLNKTSPEIASKYERSKCSTGDLIISIRATVGAVAILPPELDGANLTQGTARISADEEKVGRYFLFQLFLTKAAKFIINKHVKGSTFKEITLTKLRNLTFPIPDRSLQNEFELIFLKVNKIKEDLRNSLSELQILFQSTLQDAFSEESQINEDEVFESLLKTFTKEDLKQGNRLKHLLKWINCKEPRFSQFESYDLAWDRLRELLEDGSIEQVLDEDEIKLKIVE